MKLTLQLVVVVLNAQTNFRDYLLKFTLLYNISRHAPFQHNLFHEIRTPTVNQQTCLDSRNRIASEKFANIWRIKRDGISANKFETVEIHFLSDVPRSSLNFVLKDRSL